MKNDIANLRQEYQRAELTKRSVDADPFAQFSLWFNEAVAADVAEPSAMTLATADSNGRTSSRIVLLKGLASNGLVFFTNYESTKGQDLAANPQASLLFFWPDLERQIRIDGMVEKVAEEESDEYFASRPFESRIGALASAQSSVLSSRDELEERYARLLTEHSQGSVTRPASWGGYLVKPLTWEFWQGRPSRLHDRIRYSKEDSSWKIERLSP